MYMHLITTERNGKLLYQPFFKNDVLQNYFEVESQIDYLQLIQTVEEMDDSWCNKILSEALQINITDVVQCMEVFLLCCQTHLKFAKSLKLEKEILQFFDKLQNQNLFVDYFSKTVPVASQKRIFIGQKKIEACLIQILCKH